MFGLLRNLFALIGLIAVIGGGISFYLYESVDPCRILAMEKSDDTIEGLSEALGGDGSSLGAADSAIEATYLAIISQYSTASCASELTELWRGNLPGSD